MPLSPQERADFDTIVAHLRMEDASVGTIEPRSRSTLLLWCLAAAALVLAVGLLLVQRSPQLLGPVLVAVAMVGGMTAALRACVRTR